jgi:hypothetical protein
MMLLGAQKCFGNHVSHMLLLKVFGTDFARGARTGRPHPPSGPDRTPGVPHACSNDSGGHGLRSKLVRKSSMPWGVPRQPSVGRP